MVIPRARKSKVFAFLFFLFCIGALSVVSAGGVLAQNAISDALGTVYEKSFKLGDRHIPLPAGPWTLQFRERGQAEMGAAVGADRVYVYLTQLEGERLKGYIWGYANITLSAGGLSRSRDVCDRTDSHWNSSDKNYSPINMECWNVNHIMTRDVGTNPSKIRKEFYEWSKDKGQPSSALVNQIVIAKFRDYMLVVYYRNPELEGFPRETVGTWRDSHWYKNNASADPEKIKYIESVKAEGERLFTLLKEGFFKPLAK